MANAQINLKFVDNRLGGQNLAHDGHLYRIKFTRGERTYWRCTVSTCPATVNTRNRILVGFGRHPHSHPANHASIVAKEIMSYVKTRSQREVRPIPSIYQEEVTKLRDSDWDDEARAVVQQIPTFNSARSALYRARRKQTPRLPKTRAEIDLDGRWTETVTGERFLLFDDGDDARILAFATFGNLTNLAAADTVFCDGTFYTCPTLFHQIYTIHAEVDGAMTPLVYALLPGKSQDIYIRFLSLLKTAMHDCQLQLSPTTVFADFEIALHNAMRHVFPGVSMKGCFFHYTQCIWRKVQQTGLQTAYRENDDIRKLVRRAAVLPLIPQERVEVVWFNALDDLEDAELPNDTTPLTDYVVNQWIEGDTTMWNHYTTEGPRTTNHLESWHAKLKKKVQHAHPNLYTIIQVFKDTEASNEISNIQKRAGGSQRPRSRKYRRIDSRLTVLKQRLETGAMDLMDYADAASTLLHLG
ncbi:uncharacterized protein [Argopecten irradians]|uniref:uncharacterized protein n=1 Tax=Argopecten irradians TaxID=31199 RepID=UPI0037234E99